MQLYSVFREKFFDEQTHVRDLILAKGCYDEKKNRALYDKHFKYVPNRLKHVHALYGLKDKKVLDIGSGYGQFLLHFGPGSMGIELDPERFNFAKSLGLQVQAFNFEEKWDLPKGEFEAVWASNVLEHTVSPYLFLKKIHRALKVGGVAIIGIPTVPKNPVYGFFTTLLFGKLGYQSMEHTNGYTHETATFALSRAGFVVEDVNVFMSGNKVVNQLLKPAVLRLASQAVIVCRKTESYEGPRIFVPRWFEENL